MVGWDCSLEYFQQLQDAHDHHDDSTYLEAKMCFLLPIPVVSLRLCKSGRVSA